MIDLCLLFWKGSWLNPEFLLGNFVCKALAERFRHLLYFRLIDGAFSVNLSSSKRKHASQRFMSWLNFKG